MAEAGGSGALILAEAGLENKSIFVLADRRLQLAASLREREGVVVCEGWRGVLQSNNIQSNKPKNTNSGGGEKAGQKHTVHQSSKSISICKKTQDLLCFGVSQIMCYLYSILERGEQICSLGVPQEGYSDGYRSCSIFITCM
ncbi:hypothetical protein AMECASPLE_019405 [Ameca splendens]|uniref:Uncharacterized protein n=1 Tax=Ameca splendens TaxID=208324 RepID=A0ABV0ZCQ0_9TELE